MEKQKLQQQHCGDQNGERKEKRERERKKLYETRNRVLSGVCIKNMDN